MAKSYPKGRVSKSASVKIIDITDLQKLKEDLEEQLNREYIPLRYVSELYNIASSNAARFFTRRGMEIIKRFNTEHHREMLYVKRSDAEAMVREKSSGGTNKD